MLSVLGHCAQELPELYTSSTLDPKLDPRKERRKKEKKIKTTNKIESLHNYNQR